MTATTQQSHTTQVVPANQLSMASASHFVQLVGYVSDLRLKLQGRF